MPDYTHQGQTITYSLRSTPRAKKISIRVTSTQDIELIYPAFYPMSRQQAEDILQKKFDWILKNQAVVAHNFLPAAKPHYEAGEEMYYLGEPYTLVWQKQNRKNPKVLGINGSSLVIGVPANLPKDQTAVMQVAVKKWYTAQGEQYLFPRLAELASHYGFTYISASLRDLKASWGSCSSTGNIRLSKRLIMAHPKAIDYVLVHELCHLKEMNHSARFWRLVAQLYPTYPEWDTWLNRYQNRLSF